MKKVFIIIVLCVNSWICYCQTSNLIQLVAKFQKARIELNRVNPNTDPTICIEKSSQIIDLYNKISIIDSTYIEPYTLYIPYCMMAYSYYGQKMFKEAIPYLEKAKTMINLYPIQISQSGINEEGRIGILIVLRDAYDITGDFQKAITTAKEIVSICEKKLPRKVAFQTREESLLYQKNGNQKAAINCLKEALNLYEKYGNEVSGFYALTIVNDLLMSYLQIQDYDSALDFVDNNRDRLNTLFIGKDEQEFEALNHTNMFLYQIYQYKGLFLRAANAALIVSNYFKLVDDDQKLKYACWVNNAARSFLQSSDILERNNAYLNNADSLFNLVGKIWESIPQRDSYTEYATYLGNYGCLLSSRKMYKEAEELIIKSLNLIESQNAPKQIILTAKCRLANVMGNSGKIKEAISLYSDLYNDYLQLNDTVQMAQICYWLSQTYWIDLNDFESAERYANQAVDLISSLKNTTVIAADILQNIGTVYFKLGIERRAIDIYYKAIDMKISLGVNASPYEMLNLYEFYYDTYGMVDFYFPQSLHLDLLTIEEGYCKSILDDYQGNSYEEKQLRWKAKTVLAKGYMFSKQFKEAEKEYYDLLKIEEELWGLNSNNYITSLNNLAYCYGLWGDQQKCREISLKCAEIDPNHHNYENILMSSIALNDIKMVEKYLPLTFNASLDYLKKHFLFLSAEQREEFIECGSVGFSNLPIVAYAYPNNNVCAEFAYNSALVYKGLLLSTQNEIKSAIDSSNNSVIKEQYAELKRLENQLQVASDSTNIVLIKRAIELHEKDILASLKTYSDYTKYLNITYKDVRNKLKDNDVAIEFIELHNSVLDHHDTLSYYGALVLKNEWVTPKFVLLSEKATLDSVLKSMIIEFNEANGYQGKEWISISKKLYKSIWEPISSLIHVDDCIYFSPVGMLSLIPMEILQDSLGNTIEEQHNLYRVSTTKYLCMNHQYIKEKHAVLYGGLIYDSENETSSLETNTSKREGWQYLPATAEEIADINRILQSCNYLTRVFDKLNGTEESFKSLSKKPISIIHLATHGFYFDRNESDTYSFFRDMNVNINRGARVSTLIRSGLMLSGGQEAWLHGKRNIPQGKEDGILLASEISLLDLHTVDLVTLSACQTGLGDISNDGVLGLQRGFKRAGVNSLLITLWPVENIATKLMITIFYQNLMRGLSKRQALLSAKKYLREYNNGYYKEPRYWAAFILLDGIDY